MLVQRDKLKTLQTDRNGILKYIQVTHRKAAKRKQNKKYKIAGLGLNMSAIILIVNDLNMPIKKQRLAGHF